MTYNTVNTLDFTGDGITFLGFIGIVSALLITVVAFRRFFNSPYNVRYVNPEESVSNDREPDND
jgi:hypothetical protein